MLGVLLGEVSRGEFAVEGGLELDALVDGVVFEADELVLRVLLDVLPVLARTLGGPAHLCLLGLGREGVEVVAVRCVGPQVDVQLLLRQDVLTHAAAEGELHEALQGQPGIFVELESLPEEVLGSVAGLQLGQQVVDLLALDLPQQLLLVLGLPGSLAGQHLVEDDAQRPDIRLQRVLVPPKGLGRHVERRAHVVLVGLEGIADLDGEAKVGDLEFSVAHEDIGGFEVAVDDAVPGEVEVPDHDLLHVLAGLVLAEALLDDLAEVIIAELSDDVGIVLGGEDVV